MDGTVSDMTEQRLQEIEAWVAQEMTYLCDMGCDAASTPLARMKAVEALIAEVRLQAQQNTSLREDCDFHIQQRDAALAERDAARQEAADLSLQLKIAETALKDVRQELAHWQTCSQCGEQMDAPGHCTSGQAEWAKGQSEMLEQAIAERDMWKARAEAQVQVIRHEPRAKDLAAALAEVALLREQVAGLDREVKRGYLAERDYQATNLKLIDDLKAARRNEMPWNLENVARRWGWDGQQALSCFFDDQIYARHTELVHGQLHGPSCPYRGGDEDSCTCRPEELASRWKAQWLLVKTERDAVQSALDSLVVMAHTNPTQPLAYALRTVPITVAIVSQDVSVLPEAPHGEEA